jgi:hypothetical protein
LPEGGGEDKILFPYQEWNAGDSAHSKVTVLTVDISTE